MNCNDMIIQDLCQDLIGGIPGCLDQHMGRTPFLFSTYVELICM